MDTSLRNFTLATAALLPFMLPHAARAQTSPQTKPAPAPSTASQPLPEAPSPSKDRLFKPVRAQGEVPKTDGLAIPPPEPKPGTAPQEKSGGSAKKPLATPAVEAGTLLVERLTNIRVGGVNFHLSLRKPKAATSTPQ